MEVAAVDKIGNTLARQATDVKGLSGAKMFDEGVVAPFKASAKEFQAMVNSNVPLHGIGGITNGNRRRRRRRLIEPLQSNTPSKGIINSIQSVRDKFMEIQHNIEILAKKKEDLSSTDLMKMQYNITQLAYLNELSSKAADKTSQGAQTLFRNQG